MENKDFYDKETKRITKTMKDEIANGKDAETAKQKAQEETLRAFDLAYGTNTGGTQN